VSYTAGIAIAPVVTLERVNDLQWNRPDRWLYERAALRFVPSRDTVPLRVDHDEDSAIGTVHQLSYLDWVDGPWIYALATIDDPPKWLQRGTKASVGMKAPRVRAATFDAHENVVSWAIVDEISVLSPGVEPREPRAQVLSLSRTESPAAVTTSGRAVAGEVILGNERIIRRNVGTILAVGGKPLRTSSGYPIRSEGRDYVIDQPDGSQVIYSAEGYREALRDGQVLGVR
jgi:hypothetical protein